jgi:hypothetical protein
MIRNSGSTGVQPIPLEVWNECDTIPRDSPQDDPRVQPLDRFEVQLSAYMGERFTFSVIGTRDPSQALALEKACIATVARCSHCKEIAAPPLRPKNGFLWNSQHTNAQSQDLTDELWMLLCERAKIES